MRALAWVDGEVLPVERARLPLLDRGVLYGDGVFEVVRTYGGRPFALDEHLARLERSASRIGIALPATAADIDAVVERLLREAGAGDAYVRIIVTRGEGPIGYDPSAARDPRLVVLVAPLPPLPAGLHENGAEVRLVPCSRPTDEARAAGAKVSDYLANLLALAEARRAGAYEAVLVGPAGEVLEGASSNVFVVDEQGRLRTPPTSARILAGITRAHVLEVARAARLVVEQRVLFPPDLYGAREAFITSTLREVVPVVRVDGWTVGDGRPGPVTRALLAALRERIAAAVRRERTRSMGVH
ncbi:MAG: aminotransferase class IV [Myxococcota bacterium]|nr:aminotransferase class IV [Myxococcota bacterium]MDW8362656.1 aminotransferase class IV [Myxococcales bacterium]